MAERLKRDADEDNGKDEFLAKARERFRAAKDFWDDTYSAQKDDLRFYGGNSDNNDQWPDNVYLQRSAPDGNTPRPCLTINRLPQFHAQIVNSYRQSEIGMKAEPQDATDETVANIYAGLFKQIEKQSFAQIAYTKALSDAAIHGLGYWRVTTRYATDDSFDQDIFIDRVISPFKHYPDPKATGMFLEDAEYWFVIERISEDEYEDQYPDADPEDFIADEPNQSDWRGEKEIVIAEYFYYERKERTLCLFLDGSTKWEDEIKDKEGANAHIIKRRKVDAKVLKWCKIDGYNLLEETEWPTSRIPIVPVWGNELWVDDKRQLTGIVSPAKDSQRMYNYWQSAKTEMIALAPKAPFIAAEGQLENREEEWRDATVTPKSVLYYKPVSVDGHLVPAPQRNSYEAPVQAIIQASMQSSDDMKATIGIYDASLGNKGNETSGRAINARKMQGETASYNFIDNLALSMSYTGTIVSELIPKIYDTKRSLRIVGSDNTSKVVTVNGQSQTSPDIVNIRYDLVLDTGPSYATQREESTQTLLELSHNFPKLMDIAADIIVRGMNFKDANAVADRLRNAIPPQVIGDNDDPATKLAGAMQQVSQMTNALKIAQGELDKITQENKELKVANANKAGENKLRMAKLDIDKLLAEAQLANAKSNNPESQAFFKDALDTIHNRMSGLMDMVEALATPDADPSGPTPDDPSTPPPAPGTPIAPPQAAPAPDDSSTQGEDQ